jgi:hypothetical protein
VQSWAVLDCAGTYKAAAFELRRLYAPAHASLQFEVGDERVRLWTMLDNAHSSVEGDAVVEARNLADGRLLKRWSQFVQRAPGERGVSIDADVSGLSATETLIAATFAGAQTTRLLCEPKDAKLTQPQLFVSPHPEGIVVEVDCPVVDLFVWDARGELSLSDNFITFPTAGRAVLRGRGRARQLSARSLAGLHRVSG